MYQKLISANVLFLLLLDINPDSSCTTPNNEAGNCILLKLCPSLLQKIEEKSTASIEFIRSSICGFEQLDSKVCCASSTNVTDLHNKNKTKTNNKHLLPSRRFCGFQHSDDYLRDTNHTTVTEYPWLARLGYRLPGSSEMRYSCLGSLINNRYVLTGATCVSLSFLPVEVQLGEYHVDNHTDCVLDSAGLEECSDPVQTFKIENIVSHPHYSKVDLLDDIALVRLDSNVVYSDYIRPICLPYPGTKFANIGDVLVQSGWGYINLSRDQALTKKRVLSTLVSADDCQSAYLEEAADIAISDYHLCTRIIENATELSCVGDGGAPLTFSHKMQWHQEGIVSFGQTTCGSRLPDVFTRVEKYLDWIEENIEP